MFCGMYIPDGRAFTDQTGRFLIPSISGDQYLLIFYHYDSNLQNRTKEQHVAAYKRTLHIFKKRGLQPKLIKLDNEASKLLTEYLDGEKIEFQLATAHVH
jgi:hypothetical protein